MRDFFTGCGMHLIIPDLRTISSRYILVCIDYFWTLRYEFVVSTKIELGGSSSSLQMREPCLLAKTTDNDQQL